MSTFEPLLVDTTTARAALGNMGKTMFFELLNSGVLERRKLGRKTLVTVASIRAFAASLKS